MMPRPSPGMVKTILFNSGRDAVLATAVYLKFGRFASVK
jgi:hypothetical protein